MILDVWSAIAVTGGALAGFGVYLFIAQFVPSTPALGPALRRLHPTLVAAAPEQRAAGRRDGARLPQFQLPQFQPARADLDILGRTPQSHLLSMSLSAGFSLLLPVLITISAVLADFPIPVLIPLLLTVLVAAGVAALVHVDMRAKARLARSEFVRALCTYCALTAHQVRSGHGAVESMERSAGICDGWPYTRLRTALLTAQLQMRTPWDELKALAEAIAVVELATFADIMRTAGNDGTQVYQTLRAQASSLRDQIRIRALETAKTRTSKLDVPSTLLIVILLVLVAYPLLAGLFNQA